MVVFIPSSLTKIDRPIPYATTAPNAATYFIIFPSNSRWFCFSQTFQLQHCNPARNGKHRVTWTCLEMHLPNRSGWATFLHGSTHPPPPKRRTLGLTKPHCHRNQPVAASGPMTLKLRTLLCLAGILQDVDHAVRANTSDFRGALQLWFTSMRFWDRFKHTKDHSQTLMQLRALECTRNALQRVETPRSQGHCRQSGTLTWVPPKLYAHPGRPFACLFFPALRTLCGGNQDQAINQKNEYKTTCWQSNSLRRNQLENSQ